MPLLFHWIIAGLIGGGLGLLIGWLVCRRRHDTVALANSRDEFVLGHEALVKELRQQIMLGNEKQINLQEQLREADRRNAESSAEAKLLNERLATEQQRLETIQTKFLKEFEAVSNKLFVDNSNRFNQQSVESVGKLLAPLKETLGEFKVSLETTRKEAATHSALLKDQIGRIGAEAANLSRALKGDVKVMGNWGENMLDQILEKSGLQQGLHYRRQRSAKDAEGEQRFLDVIVDLPEKRNLVIDSKVSLRAYEESVNTTDEASKLVGLERHIESIRKHFKDLGAKRYHDIHGINTPDFVLMYVPVEAAFFAAVAQEPKLFAEALEHNVVLITNSTLLATLRTVSHVWRLADQQKHVLEIADRGGKLYDKFVGFVEDLREVGDSLGKARKAWDDASVKLHTGSGNLVSQTEKLKQLGAKAAKSLPPELLLKAGDGATSVSFTPNLPPSS